MAENISTTVHVCEDVSQSFDLIPLLTQAGYVPSQALTSAVVTSNVTPGANFWTLQGTNAIEFNAGAFPNVHGSFSLSLEFREQGVAEPFGLDLSIVVNPVNDAPTAQNPVINLGTATRYTIQEADLGFADVEADAFKSLVVHSLPATGTLLLNGSLLVVPPRVPPQNYPTYAEVSIADIRAGKLVYERPSAGAGSASFGFSVRDNGGNEGCSATDVSAAYTYTLRELAPPPPPPAPVPSLTDFSIVLLGLLMLAFAKRHLPGRSRR